MPPGGPLCPEEIFRDIASALVPFAGAPDFIQHYGTGMHKASLDIPLLMRYKGPIGAVYRVHPRLTFAEKDIAKILGIVADLQRDVWSRPLTPAEKCAYQEQIGKRMRTMFHHINDARSKHSPQWVCNLLDYADEGQPAKKKRSCGKVAPQWVHDFDWQNHRVYRYPIGSPGKQIVAERLITDRMDQKFPLAVFGSQEVEVQAITCLELQELETKAAKQKEEELRAHARRLLKRPAASVAESTPPILAQPACSTAALKRPAATVFAPGPDDVASLATSDSGPSASVAPAHAHGELWFEGLSWDGKRIKLARTVF